MNKKQLTILILVSLLLSAQMYAEELQLTIIHSNDLHSHLLGFSPNIDYTPGITDDDETLGGWARISTLIAETRNSRENPVLVLDGGDFSMGTLFHLLTREQAFELELLKMMNYDAAAIGNHEYDLKPEGLAQMLESAQRKGTLPRLVCSNTVFDPANPEDDHLEALFKEDLVSPYIIIEKEGLRIGIFGLMGIVAAEDAHFSDPVSFANPVEAAKRTVKILKDKEKADLVICLSHSGLDADPKKSEDEILAAKVDGIDIIISGHTHTLIKQPIIKNDTIIVQAGVYGQYLGIIDLVYRDGKTELESYKLAEINDSIPGDPVISAKIEDFKKQVNRDVLKTYGLSFDQVLAETDFDMELKEAECGIGNLIADSLLWYANKYVYDSGNPESKVVFAVESNGVTRGGIAAGKTGRIALCDVFRTIPLGIGVDNTVGYPVLSMYLYGREIKKIFEILTSIYPLKSADYFLQHAGFSFTYNPKRMLFDRVSDIRIQTGEDSWEKFNYSPSNKKLYRITGNIYNSAFLNLIGDYTMNILKIVPKDSQGNPAALADLRIDMDPETPGIQEMKEWIGLIEYIKTFPDTDNDGIPNIPEKYRGAAGRTVSEPSLNPFKLLKRGSWVTWTVFGIIVLIIAGITLLTLFIIRRIRRKRSS